MHYVSAGHVMRVGSRLHYSAGETPRKQFYMQLASRGFELKVINQELWEIWNFVEWGNVWLWEKPWLGVKCDVVLCECVCVCVAVFDRRMRI